MAPRCPCSLGTLLAKRAGPSFVPQNNGASHWHVSQNVATNSTTQWAFFMTPGTGVPANAAHNNTLDNFWYQDEAPPNNGCEK